MPMWARIALTVNLTYREMTRFIAFQLGLNVVMTNFMCVSNVNFGRID